MNHLKLPNAVNPIFVDKYMLYNYKYDSKTSERTIDNYNCMFKDTVLLLDLYKKDNDLDHFLISYSLCSQYFSKLIDNKMDFKKLIDISVCDAEQVLDKYNDIYHICYKLNYNLIKYFTESKPLFSYICKSFSVQSLKIYVIIFFDITKYEVHYNNECIRVCITPNLVADIEHSDRYRIPDLGTIREFILEKINEKDFTYNNFEEAVSYLNQICCEIDDILPKEPPTAPISPFPNN